MFEKRCREVQSGCPRTLDDPFQYRPRVDAPPDEADLLAREPAVLTGALIGYARVSTADQILDRQTRALAEVGCSRRPRRRTRPRYPPRPATCHDPRADPSRPRPTHPAREHRCLDRQAARRLPQHDLQVPARDPPPELYPTPTYPLRRPAP